MSSYSQLGSLVGNAIGSYFGGSFGGALGSAIGSYLGSSVDPALTNYGPRLSDLKVQNGSYGSPIAVSFGTSRVAGTVIFLTPIREHTRHEEVSGKGGQRVYNDTYSYDMDVAVVITDQHGFPIKGITGVRRIWANGALVHSNADDASLGTLIASSELCEQVTVYPGDYAQLPDPTIEASVGVGNASAYRGFSYAVFKGLYVTGKGSPVPQFEFEVVQGGTVGVAKTIFSSYQPSATEVARAGDVWCGAKAAVVVNYDATRQKIGVHEYEPGVADPVSHVDEYVDGSYSGTPRRFANCTTAPVMFDVNFMTSTSTDGMTLRLWDVRGNLVEDLPGGTASKMILLQTQVPVGSYPYYAMQGVFAVVAYEEATKYLAYGGNQGAGAYYGQRAIFVVDGEKFNCLLPASDRQTIDMGIWLGVLYIWNRSLTPDPAHGGNLRTYITAFDDSGSLLYDAPHTIDSFSNGGQAWSRICVNEFGIFTWCPNPPITTVARFTIDGPVILCTDANVGGTDTPVGDSTTGPQGFWCNGSFCNIGGSTISLRTQTSHCWTVLFQAISKGTVSLGYALSTIASIAGLELAEIDVAEQTQTLRGYAYKQVASAVSFLSPLCTVFYTEGFESEGMLRFRNLGGPTVMDIPFDELGFSDGIDDEVAEPFELTRAQEKDLPRSLSVVYANWDADFQVGSEAPSKRLITSSVNDVVIETPVTATADESIKRQDVLLYKAWLERDTRKATLSRKYIALDPSDPINVEWPRGTWRRYRIRRVDYQGICSSYELVRDEPSVLISAAKASNIAREQATLTVAGRTLLKLLDIPILRDLDDGPGYYAAFGSNATNWSGASLQKQQDTGDFAAIGSITSRAPLGEAVTALPDWAGGNLFDNVNVVRVRIGSSSLSNASAAALVASSVNSILIGEEILQFRRATPVSAGIYDLSGLLRYRRGTDAAAPHAAGDVVLLLQAAGLLRVRDTLGDRDVAHSYRAVTNGQAAGDALTTSFADHEKGLMPFGPVTLAVAPTTPLRLSWRRRSRLTTSFLKADSDVPLGEGSEAYEVDVVDPAGNVTSTLTSTTNSVAIGSWLPQTQLVGAARLAGLNEVSGVLYGVTHASSGTGDLEWIAAWNPVSGARVGAMLISRMLGGFDDRTTSRLMIAGADAYAMTSGYHGPFLLKWPVAAIAASSDAWTSKSASLQTNDTTVPNGSGGPLDVAASFCLAPSGLWLTSPSYDGRLRNVSTSGLAITSLTRLAPSASAALSLGEPYLDPASGDLFVFATAYATGVPMPVVARVSIAATPTITATIPLPDQPYGAGALVAGGNLWIPCAKQTLLLDLATGSFVASIPLRGGIVPSLASLGSRVVMGLDGRVEVRDAGDAAIVTIIPIAPGGLGTVRGTTADGIVVNTLPSLAAYQAGENVVYRYADLSAGFKARVYQLSAAVGRGFPSKDIALA